MARSFSSTASSEASDRSVACMYFCTPTSDFFRASKELEYNIFFLTLAVSGHHDIKNSFCFLDACKKMIITFLRFSVGRESFLHLTYILYRISLIRKLPRKYPDTDEYIQSRTDHNGTPHYRPFADLRERRHKPHHEVRWLLHLSVSRLWCRRSHIGAFCLSLSPHTLSYKRLRPSHQMPNETSIDIIYYD